jgi:hypothetical protein
MLEGNGQGYLASLLRSGAMPFARPARGGAAFGVGEKFRSRSTLSGELQSELQPAVESATPENPDASSHESSSDKSEDTFETPATGNFETLATDSFETPETSIHALPSRSAATRFRSIEHADADAAPAPVEPPTGERRELSRRHADADHKPAADDINHPMPAFTAPAITGESVKAPARRSALEAREEGHARVVESEIVKGFESKNEDVESEDAGAAISPARVEGEFVRDERLRLEFIETVSHANATQPVERNRVARKSPSSVAPLHEASPLHRESPARDVATHESSDLTPRVFKESIHDLRFLYRDTPSQESSTRPVSSKPDGNFLPEGESTASSPSVRAPRKAATHDLRNLFRDAAQSTLPDAAADSVQRTSEQELNVSANQSRREHVVAESTETDLVRVSEAGLERASERVKRANEAEKRVSTRTREEVSANLDAEVRAGEARQAEARRASESLIGDESKSISRAEQKGQRGRDVAPPPSRENDERFDENGERFNDGDERLPARADDSFGRDATRGQNVAVKDKGAFSLKVNRLDIKLINHAPKSPPAPTARQSPAQPKAEDYLERHYLGRFYLDM